MNPSDSGNRRSQRPSSLPLSLHASLLAPTLPTPPPLEEPREARDSHINTEPTHESETTRPDHEDEHIPHTQTSDQWRTQSFSQTTRTPAAGEPSGRQRRVTAPAPAEHSRSGPSSTSEHTFTPYTLPGPSRLSLQRDYTLHGTLASYATAPYLPVSYGYPTSTLTGPLPPPDRLGFPARLADEAGPSRYYEGESSHPADLGSPPELRNLPSLVSQERTSIRGRPLTIHPESLRRRPLEIGRSHSLPRDPRSSFDNHPSGIYDSLNYQRRNPPYFESEHLGAPRLCLSPPPVSLVNPERHNVPPYVEREHGEAAQSPLPPPPIPPPPISIGGLELRYPESPEFPQPRQVVFQQDLHPLENRPRTRIPSDSPIQLPPLRAAFPISPEQPIFLLRPYEPTPPGPVELPPFSFDVGPSLDRRHERPSILEPSSPTASTSTLVPEVLDINPPRRGRGARVGRGRRKRQRVEVEPEKPEASTATLVNKPEDTSESEDEGGPLRHRLRPYRTPTKVAIACNFCRRRKLKCNGMRPVCGNCNKRSEPCQYVLHPKRRGPGKKPKETSGQRSAQATEAQQPQERPSSETAPGSDNPPPPVMPISEAFPPPQAAPPMPTEHVFSLVHYPLALTPLQREEERRREAGEPPLGSLPGPSTSRDTGGEQEESTSSDFDEYLRDDYTEPKPPPRPPDPPKS